MIIRTLLFILAFHCCPAFADDTPVQPTAHFAVEDLRSDFKRLYQGLQSAHADLYVHRSRSEYDALYKQMLGSIDQQMSATQARVFFQTFVAFGNVAHARIEFPQEAFQSYRERGGRTLPIYLRIADGDTFVGENYSGDERIKVGQKLVAINDIAIDDWLRRTASHVSADTPYIAHSLLEFMFPRYLWLELGDVSSFELRLLGAGGDVENIIVAALTQEAQQANAQKQTRAFSLSGNDREGRMIDDKIAYLRPGPFYHAENPAALWDNAAFKAFVDDRFQTFIESGASSLIIDLRQNPGGDNSFSDQMLAWIANEPFRFCSAFIIRSSDEAAASNQRRLDAQSGATQGVSYRFAKQYAKVPRGETFEFDIALTQPRTGKRFDGEVFALIDRHSYSNAVNVAAIIQDYGLGTIVGEKTSDMATTYGAMETFSLPHTNIEVGFPKAHIVRPSGETAAEGVTPDWPIPSPIGPVTNDVVLEALVNRIAAANQ